MPENIEDLIKTFYRARKDELTRDSSGHPDEEAFSLFFEGRLTDIEANTFKEHLIRCSICSEVLAVLAQLGQVKEFTVPENLIYQVKDSLQKSVQLPVLEIFIRLTDKLIELLDTTGDVLVGQELVPAPILRSRKIKDFKDEIIILKDIEDIRVEVKLEKKTAGTFSLMVLAKEKATAKIIKNTRITLWKGDLELESYLTDSGKVIFEHVVLGKYKIEISDIGKKIVSVILDVKA